jgi:hypothetical protein
MAKRKASRRTKRAKRTTARMAPKRSAKRAGKKAAPRRKARAAAKPAKKRRPLAAKRTASARTPARPTAAGRVKTAAPRPSRPIARKTQEISKKTPRLDRVRRTLTETVPTPPSSLDLDRHGSAARTGRAEIAEHLHDHASMTPAITAGDVDVDVENAYFSGDEAPGGDNPTPDQDVVDDIGKALGVQYDDNEELKGSDKILERDKHRWEMDPASSEDYKDRK